MPIPVQCPCGKRSQAKDEAAGKKLKCPACGQVLAIPLPRPPAQHEGGMLDILEAELAAGPAAAAPGPLVGRPVGHPAGAALGALPRRKKQFNAIIPSTYKLGAALGALPRRKKGSNRTLFIVLEAVAGGGVLLLGGLIVALGLYMQSILSPANPFLPPQPAPIVPIGPVWSPDPAAPIVPIGPVWSPDPALVGQLGSEATFDRYALGLPQGFTPFAIPVPPTPPGAKLQAWTWAGVPAPNGTRDVLVVEVIEAQTPAAQMELRGGLEFVKHNFIARMGNSFAGITQTAAERGQLAGKAFIRTRISGTQAGALLHGFVLLTIEGNKLVVLMGMCVDPPGSAAYNQLETAALTFRPL